MKIWKIIENKFKEEGILRNLGFSIVISVSIIYFIISLIVKPERAGYLPAMFFVSYFFARSGAIIAFLLKNRIENERYLKYLADKIIFFWAFTFPFMSVVAIMPNQKEPLNLLLMIVFATIYAGAFFIANIQFSIYMPEILAEMNQKQVFLTCFRLKKDPF